MDRKELQAIVQAATKNIKTGTNVMNNPLLSA